MHLSRSKKLAAGSNRFVNHKEYKSLFSKRPVLVERQLKLDDFSVLKPLFENLGWESLTTISGSAVVKLVQEFYANFTEHSDLEKTVIHSVVTRVPITVTPDTIATYLGIERPSPTERLTMFYPTQDGLSPTKAELSAIFQTLDGSPPWIGESYVHGLLNTNHRMLNLFVSATIDPTSHYLDLTIRRGHVIYAIFLGLKFDVALFIFRLIYTSQQMKHTRDSLPFGVIITNILMGHGIPLPSDVSHQLNPISRITARKSMSQAIDSTQHDIRKSESNKSSRPFTMNQLSLSLIRLEGEVVTLREKQDTLSADVRALTTMCTANFKSLHQKIDNLSAYEDELEGPMDEDATGGGDNAGGGGAGRNMF